MAMKATCQLNVVASHTVMNETITPTFVPELNSPVANARSRCGNHIAAALMEAGKLAASATPRKKRTSTKPSTVPTKPCAAAMSDQSTSATARLFLTPQRSIPRPVIEGTAAYATVNANVIQP